VILRICTARVSARPGHCRAGLGKALAHCSSPDSSSAHLGGHSAGHSRSWWRQHLEHRPRPGFGSRRPRSPRRRSRKMSGRQPRRHARASRSARVPSYSARCTRRNCVMSTRASGRPGRGEIVLGEPGLQGGRKVAGCAARSCRCLAGSAPPCLILPPAHPAYRPPIACGRLVWSPHAPDEGHGTGFSRHPPGCAHRFAVVADPQCRAWSAR
jgi:hypothetical protein